MKLQHLKKTNYILFLLHILFLCLQQIRAEQKLPLVINTWAFEEANIAAWEALQNTGRPIDAVIAGCGKCEELQCHGTVGYGGSPDENGETTLDAMLMDGETMNIGAVAGLRQIKNAIGVARNVLENTRHTLLVGDSASNFAEMMGFQRESLTTPNSKAIWEEWRKSKCQPNFWQNVRPNPSKQCGPYKPLPLILGNLHDSQRYDLEFGPWNHDTIGMIAINTEGSIYAGTSTNGARHKIPGRVGDSPIPGAGAYADNEVGAAVATGDGDVMMRFLPALIAVEGLRMGRSPAEAAQNAINRIVRYYPEFSGALVVTDRYGNYSAACMGMEKFPFSIANGARNTRVEYKICAEETIYRKHELK
ncbi:putative N(4)-(beta-N-acetylglucosaminyl)-L-asparaginase GD10667 [Teleopsis dalmanni]|uniref:putative N(4)-(beta-N-acetylglucosaminyl)-L-asparaginase GD10667 n=1 Tax=Teleopsis dalmanni TaxID=139649 RepID=UPI0018CF13F7|nr:putative N(4)-(beta-N-acetylglucosaminyl)-L-asparaginase GD10667 [Teleopsis dalmanni]